MASKFKQEMPPVGGYAAYDWVKKAPRRTNGFLVFGAFIGITTLAWVNRYFQRTERQKIKLEMRESRIAVEPLFWAEAHREFLKHMRRNRDEENELMKDVTGWETGTLFGKPVTYNERERFKWPDFEEYYMHCHDQAMNDRKSEVLYH